jgi:hypothetical protein
MFFGRRKSLDKLSLEALSDRQGTLMLELLSVNVELIKRYRVLVDLAKDMIGTDETIAVLGGGADRYASLNALLAAEIASRMPKNSN